MPIDTAMGLLDKKNPNKHTEDDIKDMAKTLSLVGWEHAIVIVNNSVHYGNKRTKAAKYAGFTHVPVVYRTYEAKELETITKIADNAAGQRSELDLSIVNELTLDLGPDIELDVLGIKDYKPIPEDKYANKDADDVPETKDNELNVKTGDLWILGDHRLLCGDATKKEDVERLMDGQKADMVYTDPPYGCRLKNTILGDEIKNDDLSGQKLVDFFDAVFSNLPLKDWGTVYWFYSSNRVIETRQSAEKYFKLKDTLIWVKDSFVPGRNDYQPQYEPFLYLEKIGKGKVGRVWNGNRDSSNVIKIGRDRLIQHPTNKPVALIEIGILNSSKSEALVLDPFLGSGSTLIACEKTNRKCFGMEIDPHYCSVIIKRWEKFSGQKAQKLSK